MDHSYFACELITAFTDPDLDTKLLANDMELSIILFWYASASYSRPTLSPPTPPRPNSSSPQIDLEVSDILDDKK